jgi:hypothetical protein
VDLFSNLQVHGASSVVPAPASGAGGYSAGFASDFADLSMSSFTADVARGGVVPAGVAPVMGMPHNAPPTAAMAALYSAPRGMPATQPGTPYMQPPYQTQPMAYQSQPMAYQTQPMTYQTQQQQFQSPQQQQFQPPYHQGSPKVVSLFNLLL